MEEFESCDILKAARWLFQSRLVACEYVRLEGIGRPMKYS